MPRTCRSGWRPCASSSRARKDSSSRSCTRNPTRSWSATWAAMFFFREHAPHLEQIGDFSLNVANELTADLLMREGFARLVPSYDLNWEQFAALVRRSNPAWYEPVIHQHMPMFHMEHCVFAAFLSNGKDWRDCGRPCDRHKIELRDRVGAAFPGRRRRRLPQHGLQSGAAIGRRVRAADAGAGLAAISGRVAPRDGRAGWPVARRLSPGDRRARTTAASTWRKVRAMNQLGRDARDPESGLATEPTRGTTTESDPPATTHSYDPSKFCPERTCRFCDSTLGTSGLGCDSRIAESVEWKTANGLWALSGVAATGVLVSSPWQPNDLTFFAGLSPAVAIVAVYRSVLARPRFAEARRARSELTSRLLRIGCLRRATGAELAASREARVQLLKDSIWEEASTAQRNPTMIHTECKRKRGPDSGTVTRIRASPTMNAGAIARETNRAAAGQFWVTVRLAGAALAGIGLIGSLNALVKCGAAVGSPSGLEIRL